MSPSPDQPFDPEDIPYFFDNWCSLPWTPWVPFNADKHTFKEIPHEPGLYRIRPAGKDFLMYIGSTGRSLHQRLNDLRQTLRRADLMPWSDPLPEAPALWAWWVEWAAESHISSEMRQEKNPEGFFDREEEHEALPEGAGPVMLECSAAPLDASASGRRGMESFLLYKYRQECGESPLCNFGRFHPRYRKSTIRKEGMRGGKLAEDHKDNPAGFPGIEPLELIGKPGDSDWMGLEWTDREPLAAENITGIPAGAGLYLLADAGSQEIVYIGQSEDLARRLLDYSRKTWEGRTLQFSYQIIGLSVLPHNLKELQNDLIGNFYEIGQVIRPGQGEGSEGVSGIGQVIRPGQGEESEGVFEISRKAPEFQFRNST
jgi:hypothetical protein